MNTKRINELNAIAKESGYFVEYKPTRYVRGWPEESQKPYGIYCGAKFIASFADLDTLERNLRGRLA